MKNNQEKVLSPSFSMLVSVYLTDEPLPNQRATNSTSNKLAQFLYSLQTWAPLRPTEAFFYISLGSDYRTFHTQVKSQISHLFPNAVILDNRLETFAEWRKASLLISDESSAVLIHSNHDHIFAPAKPDAFWDFLQKFQLHDMKKGNITHWPQAIGGYKVTTSTIPTKGFATATVSTASGTDLVSVEFFRSWWTTDFTNGLRITRPDNPFGPHVKFPPILEAIPSEELFRHLDGYELVDITAWPANQIELPFSMKNNQMHVTEPTWSTNYFEPKPLFRFSGPHSIDGASRYGRALGIAMLACSYRFRPWRAALVLRNFGWNSTYAMFVSLSLIFFPTIWSRLSWEIRFHLKFHFRRIMGFEIGRSVYTKG